MKTHTSRRTIFLLFLGALLLAACRGNDVQADGTTSAAIPLDSHAYTEITVSDLQARMEAKDFTLVNVHVPDQGDIPGTDLSIPFDQIEDRLDQLPVDKDAKIVVYCRSGGMSSVAARTLVRLGYTNVLNLSGGFNAWQAAGLPLE